MQPSARRKLRRGEGRRRSCRFLQPAKKWQQLAAGFSGAASDQGGRGGRRSGGTVVLGKPRSFGSVRGGRHAAGKPGGSAEGAKFCKCRILHVQNFWAAHCAELRRRFRPSGRSTRHGTRGSRWGGGLGTADGRGNLQGRQQVRRWSAGKCGQQVCSEVKKEAACGFLGSQRRRGQRQVCGGERKQWAAALKEKEAEKRCCEEGGGGMLADAGRKKAHGKKKESRERFLKG